MNAFDEKEKREVRRRNHIARDLRTPKYGQRVVSNKKRQLKDSWLWDDDWE